jgi:hypothetical protein
MMPPPASDKILLITGPFRRIDEAAIVPSPHAEKEKAARCYSDIEPYSI